MVVWPPVPPSCWLFGLLCRQFRLILMVVWPPVPPSRWLFGLLCRQLGQPLDEFLLLTFLDETSNLTIIDVTFNFNIYP